MEIKDESEWKEYIDSLRTEEILKKNEAMELLKKTSFQLLKKIQKVRKNSAYSSQEGSTLR